MKMRQDEVKIIYSHRIWVRRRVEREREDFVQLRINFVYPKFALDEMECDEELFG